jgi:hypothetical protein
LPRASGLEPQSGRSPCWDFAALRELQTSLAGRVELADRLGDVRLIAATDISAGPYATTVWAAVVVCSYPGLELRETVCVRCPQPFPYRTGLLGFREVPPLLGAFAEFNSGHTPKPNWPGIPRTQPALTPANWVSACVPN